MTNTKLQTALLRRLGSTKKRAKDGFTLIELMVVIAIVGVLSAVGLPQLLKAQDRAKISVAQQEVVNYAKECSISLLTGAAAPDATRYDTITIADPINVCAENATLRAVSGVTVDGVDENDVATTTPVTITVVMDGPIPGQPSSSEDA